MRQLFLIVMTLVIGLSHSIALGSESGQDYLHWSPIPALPSVTGQADGLGVAGPFVGVHLAKDSKDQALIVAGGANFATADDPKLWELPKRYHQTIWVLTRTKADASTSNKQNNQAWQYQWTTVKQKLDKPLAYGSAVSTPNGVLCIGGIDDKQAYADVFLLQWNAAEKSVKQITLPKLPAPSAFGGAVTIGSKVYVVGGSTTTGMDGASKNFWSLDLTNMPDKDDTPEQAKRRTDNFKWQTLPWPTEEVDGKIVSTDERIVPVVAVQHNGFKDCVYLISGRRTGKETDANNPNLIKSINLLMLTDVWEFNPSKYDAKAYDSASGTYTGKGRKVSPWRRRQDSPQCVMAGTATPVGQSHIFILSGSDGSNLLEVEKRGVKMKDFKHPGFSKKIWTYHTITNTWLDAGWAKPAEGTNIIPSNQVTTPAAKWDNDTFLISGEVSPRVRTTNGWVISPAKWSASFGAVNFTVLIVYLLAMVGVGVYFANKNKNTDDYFRGGQTIPWWAAGCSIFATMLSSITFMAIPAKAYAQDIVYLPGNMMILVAAPVAVYIALPFFRQINATSAYEYLEKRFNMPVRLFGSFMFTLFHIFRMGIVLSLAALALKAVTPLEAWHCVLLMGLLCLIYCTMGGIEAVIWTDTIQTFVLLGGGLLCLILIIMNVDGGVSGLLSTANSNEKLHLINFDFDADSYMYMALWVVIFGGMGQNISSYTADQAVVQRYMTTSNQKLAARSIWTNAWMAVPASFLFYGMGVALFVFYQANPGKLDPTINTDQVFPLFISTEVPIGIAGLIVAGIFAAAQSTVSTSMNSTATTLVTDFMRPFNVCKSEKSYLRAARYLTFTLGLIGTAIGLFFINPDIKSLFDQFIGVIGIFMGVLGGLFVLGIMSKRANGWGALVGVVFGALVMFSLPLFTNVSGYLYATVGIVCCFVVGYIASLLIPAETKDLNGLTIYTLKRKSNT